MFFKSFVKLRFESATLNYQLSIQFLRMWRLGPNFKKNKSQELPINLTTLALSYAFIYLSIPYSSQYLHVIKPVRTFVKMYSSNA